MDVIKYPRLYGLLVLLNEHNKEAPKDFVESFTIRGSTLNKYRIVEFINGNVRVCDLVDYFSWDDTLLGSDFWYCVYQQYDSIPMLYNTVYAIPIKSIKPAQRKIHLLKLYSDLLNFITS